ncbi:hypothetical protein BDB01DRAFT_908415 [Pilobolus umbonatus]|nr:hypothetical protein BDB01DRAFT_908415 [Pilobolus umbonatus]
MTNTKHTTDTFNKINKGAGDSLTITRMHPSMKRPRAPIACYRCHHKKVRCDGIHPNCTRCLSTGVLCAYPSSRRSRNTQPTNVDPFIDNLSQLEARIRRIETDLESQRSLVRKVCSNEMDSRLYLDNPNGLTTRILKTEKELQESRSIVAQLRLRGEQRIARGKRAAAAAANDKPLPSKQRNNKKPNSAVNIKKSPSPSQVESLQPFMYFPNEYSSSSYYPYDTICNAPFNMSFQDWSLLNDIPQDTGFVDPMIIAAAASATNTMPILQYGIDMNEIPHLQPSSSTTSSSTSSSFGFQPNYLMEDLHMMMEPTL